MTANASSLSVASRPERLSVDLRRGNLLSPLPRAFLTGEARELLQPLRYIPPAELPSGAPPEVDRRPLAAALEATNQAYGHPEARQLAQRLADPATRVVVTGQQPGVLGGPLYTLAKAVAAARWAAALEEAGQPALAVFKVASEDHDYAEVASVTVLAPDGPRTFDLGPDPEPLTPVGMRTLGPGVERLLAELRQAVPGERYGDWVETLERWYRPDARFGEAFCRLLVHLLGERCPLLVDAMLPEVKAAQRPWLRLLVERRRELDEANRTADRKIKQQGFEPQVTAHPEAAHLFLLSQGERRRVAWQGEAAFSLRGRDEEPRSVDKLLETIEQNPAVVSPGVLARPVIQDAILGSFLQVLGPGELGYMAQAAPFYPVLGVEPPWSTLRPQTLVLEPHQVEQLQETGLTLTELLTEESELDHLLASRAGADFVPPVRDRIEEALEELRRPALELDTNLERPWEKTRDQVLRALDLFDDKVATAAAHHNEIQAKRIERLRATCLPGGVLQERTVSSSHFPGKLGDRFVDACFEQTDLDATYLQVISP